MSADDAVAVLDGILAGLDTPSAHGLYHGHVDAQTVLVDHTGRVVLAEPTASTAASPGGDVAAATRDATRLVLPCIARGGRRMRRVQHLLEAAISGRAAESPAGLRAQLASAAASLGPGWNDRQRLAALVAAPGVAPARPRRRRRRLLWALVPLLVAGGGIAAFLFSRGGGGTTLTAAGPLTVGGDLHVQVHPSSGGCNTTFTFDATGSVSGAGALVYRWEQSDGYVTGRSTVTVTSNDASFDLTQAWRLQGAQTYSGTETFHVLTPVDRSISQSFQYHCP